MFSKDVTSAEPTKPLTCDASAWGQVSEKRTHGWRGTGIRDCVPGSRATASCLQPLHKRGHSAPRPPGAAQLLPRAGGRAPRREMGHAGGHPGLFLQKLREGGCPTWGGGRTRAVTKTGEDAVPVPSPPESPGAADTASQGRPANSPARRRGARRPCRPRPTPAGPVCSPPAGRAGGARACPTALFLIRAELASGPPRPLGPRAPGAAGLTFPARPGPARRLLRAAPSKARFRLLSHSGRLPLRPSCVRPSPPWPASGACLPAPLPQPSPFCACAPRGPGPEVAWLREAPPGAPRLRLVGLRRESSYRPTVARQPGLMCK